MDDPFCTFGHGDDKLAIDEKFQRYLKEIKESENRQLEMTGRSLASITDTQRIWMELLNPVSINDSERTRIGKAEESHNQGEQFSSTAQNSRPWFSFITDFLFVFFGCFPKQKPKPVNIQQQTFTDRQSASRSHPRQRYRADDKMEFSEDDVNDQVMEGSMTSQAGTLYFRPVTGSIKEQLMNPKINLNMISESVHDIARKRIEEKTEELEKIQISFKTQRMRK